MQKGFIFDINKCVACQACVLACQIENIDLEDLISEEKWKSQVVWREVKTHNSYEYPDLAVFHFSMACNHCELAPCMHNCPALAYSLDSDFNAIIHHQESCIGCKYCTMVCPYDAPKYNHFKGIVEKCTLCVGRLSEGKNPACANSCPTGALDYDNIKIEPQFVNGFAEIGIKPTIEIKALRKESAPKQENYYRIEEIDNLKKALKLEENQKNTLKSEWPLLIFSLLTTVLVSFFYAAFSKGLQIKFELFIVVAVLTGVLSFAHLGKKLRAWRAVLNIRKSWLSREILAYSLFVPISALWLIFPNQNELGLFATILGLVTLVSIDNVYRQIPSKAKNKYHSADVLFFTAFLYVAILVSNPWMFFAAIILKSYLYITRKITFKKAGINLRPVFSILRLCLGFIVPAILFFSLDFETSKYVILGFVVFGEVIDRIEFYLEL